MNLPLAYYSLAWMNAKNDMTQEFFIITTVFNDASRLHSAIESVVSQLGDFVIHYHVHDSGGLIETQETLRYWQTVLSVSNPFIQCRAVNFSWESEKNELERTEVAKVFKRFSIPNPSIVAWLHADCAYIPYALSTVAKAFTDEPEALLLSGDLMYSQDGLLALPERHTALRWPLKIDRGCYGDIEIRKRGASRIPVFLRGSLWKELHSPNQPAQNIFTHGRGEVGRNCAHLDIPLGVWTVPRGKADEVSECILSQPVCDYLYRSESKARPKYILYNDKLRIMQQTQQQSLWYKVSNKISDIFNKNTKNR